MKREIKFRYRLKNTAPVALSGVEPDGVMYKYLILEDIEGTNYTSMLMSYPILSRDQFTGLLDKNGKEIYEGDIIKTRMGKFREVKWGTPWAEIEGKMEIIGNIYEKIEEKRKHEI